jgi:hypothetical protein
MWEEKRFCEQLLASLLYAFVKNCLSLLEIGETFTRDDARLVEK